MYDIGLYDGQFEVSKKQAEKIVMQLDNAVERYENSIKQSKKELTYKELEIKENTSYVIKNTIEELKPEIKKKIVDEIWNLDDEIEVIRFYYSYPNEWECNCERHSIFQGGNWIDVARPASGMIVYKDTNNKYYFRICRYVRRDWFKPQEW